MAEADNWVVMVGWGRKSDIKMALERKRFRGPRSMLKAEILVLLPQEDRPDCGRGCGRGEL